MAPLKSSAEHAGRHGLRRRNVVPVILLFLLAAQAAAATASSTTRQGPARTLITTATGARLRERPDTAAAEVGRLQLGLVVEELERTSDRSRVGAAEDYWHLVSAPGGVRGWVFGGLVAPFDPARREEIYLKLAGERVANAAATFAELSELVRFLGRATREVKRREALAELELTRLVALARSLASFSMEEQEKPPYKGWTVEHEREIVYSEPAGQWYVRSDLFWQLQQKYRDLPVAERAAWDAAQTPLPGECEGFLPCHLFLQSETNGKYLQLYPRGPHAEAALANISELLGMVSEDLRGRSPVFNVARADRPEFRRTVAKLRAQIAAAASPRKAPLLRQLDMIARRFP